MGDDLLKMASSLGFLYSTFTGENRPNPDRILETVKKRDTYAGKGHHEERPSMEAPDSRDPGVDEPEQKRPEQPPSLLQLFLQRR